MATGERPRQIHRAEPERYASDRRGLQRDTALASVPAIRAPVLGWRDRRRTERRACGRSNLGTQAREPESVEDRSRHGPRARGGELQGCRYPWERPLSTGIRLRSVSEWHGFGDFEQGRGQGRAQMRRPRPGRARASGGAIGLIERPVSPSGCSVGSQSHRRLLSKRRNGSSTIPDIFFAYSSRPDSAPWV